MYRSRFVVLFLCNCSLWLRLHIGKELWTDQECKGNYHRTKISSIPAPAVLNLLGRQWHWALQSWNQDSGKFRKGHDVVAPLQPFPSGAHWTCSCVLFIWTRLKHIGEASTWPVCTDSNLWSCPQMRNQRSKGSVLSSMSRLSMEIAHNLSPAWDPVENP